MKTDPDKLHDSFGADGLFRTTHWSVVLAAKTGDESEISQAMEQLCRAYWYPLYAFVRRRGASAADAQDLTQQFFHQLLQRDFLRNIARERGRFRSFLLAALKNFLVSAWHKEHAAKRGGGQLIISWEDLGAEQRYAEEPADNVSPDRLFDQRWALAVMEQAMTQLRVELEAAGKGDHFARLRPFLSREGDRQEYAAIGQVWGVSAGAVTVAIHRLRRRYGDVLRGIVAQTVPGPDEVEDEIRFLVEQISASP
jgi:RNA polymerase sigma factor (sigma-70 family)